MKPFLRICTGALVLATSAPGALKAQTATKQVQNFFNVIAPDSADPWVFRHSDGLYYWVHSAQGRIELSAVSHALGPGRPARARWPGLPSPLGRPARNSGPPSFTT